MKRHDLIFLDKEGKKQAVQAACRLHPKTKETFIRNIIAGEGIPGIIKRQEAKRQEFIQVGYSTWYYCDGSRIRLNSEVAGEYINGVLTPFEVLERARDKQLYKQLAVLAADCGLRAGIYGSSALQEITGRPYRNTDSDIDVFVKSITAGADLKRFAERLLKLEKIQQTAFDVEVEYRDIYGIKLKELQSGQKTVLAKGLFDVQLLEREAVLREISQERDS